MALGAQRRDIWRAVFGHGLSILGVGIALGLAAALGLSRSKGSYLYGVSAHDPLTYLSVTVVIAIASLLACYIPARRATKVDPIVALRYE